MKSRVFQSAVASAGLLCASIVFTEGCAKKVAVARPAQATPAMASAAPAPRPASQERPQSPAAAPVRIAASNTRSNMPDDATKDRIQALLNRIQDAYFDYNTSKIRSDAQEALHSDAQTLSEILRGYPDYKLTVEGFCDERGSDEYNLGLGEARAQRAKQFLVESGIPSAQLRTLSFGKERPVCEDHDEACWQRNRRIHITQTQG